MQSTIQHIESIISKAGDLAETKVELFKLKATSNVSEAVSSIVSKLAIIMIACLTLLLLSFAAAFWLGSVVDSTALGFLIVGGFYALTGIIIYSMRSTLIKKPISELIIDKLSK